MAIFKNMVGHCVPGHEHDYALSADYSPSKLYGDAAAWEKIMSVTEGEPMKVGVWKNDDGDYAFYICRAESADKLPWLESLVMGTGVPYWMAGRDKIGPFSYYVWAIDDSEDAMMKAITAGFLRDFPGQKPPARDEIDLKG